LLFCLGNDDPPNPRELYIPPEPTDDETTIFSGGISCGINFNKYDNIQVKVCINVYAL
jgi:probable ATP-dependent RNA helicase DDX4